MPDSKCPVLSSVAYWPVCARGRSNWLELARTPEDVGLAAQIACLLEVSSAKPGNVNRLANFDDARFEDFLFSAAAIGPAFCAAARHSVGEIVWQAISATRKVVRSNTNLGIVLLLAPLARAAVVPGDLRANLAQVLGGLTVDDARLVYRAIRLAHAGGMGQVPEADVQDDPGITLLAAMDLARDRDTIAREYVTGFATTFEVSCPALDQAIQATDDPERAIVQASLTVLAQVPDSLIERKRGAAAACEVSERAAEVLELGGILTAAGRQAFDNLDRALRDDGHTLNPGTTADLITAAVFLRMLGEPSVRA